MHNKSHHTHFANLRVCVLALLAVVSRGDGAVAEDASKPPTAASPQAPAEARRKLYIREIRVIGVHSLPRVEVEETVYPFLGPDRTVEDVEGARSALEKAYHDKGFSATQVIIPEQTGRGGIVLLQIYEGRVGALRVKGSRYFLPSNIRRQAPSLAEGKIVNFNDVQRDIVGLNQLADRRVTPTIRAGAEPGTVDVDLNVEDKLPLHGSAELNNRNSANTTPLRLNAAVNYNNLWQLGHSAGASVQIAPEHMSDAQVFSGYYIARFPGYSDVSLMLQGTKQNSNVSSLGGADVVGRGESLGLHVLFALPQGKGFYQSFNLGIDYKYNSERVRISSSDATTPITYFPLSAAYSATWADKDKNGKGPVTDFNLTANFHIRGLGSSASEFDSVRYGADGSYLYLRGDLSHTHDLPGGFQVFAKAQAQLADQPLLNTEQFSGGGEGTVRGYLESAALGDNAFLGSIELRSPPISASFGKWLNEWRIYSFFEGGTLTVLEPLAQQQSHYTLASYGFGSRVRLVNHLNGSVDFAIPLYGLSPTSVHEGRVTFRVSTDF
jgi:hemolysin activation/secretion protein